ncbi:HAMP domain-containing histidine kinase [Chloroflexia bacterium SDU3-3]|nr:HAMP domain-containing histidine kinase [Chloroflexia bacterium SDU3-3]
MQAILRYWNSYLQVRSSDIAKVTYYRILLMFLAFALVANTLMTMFDGFYFHQLSVFELLTSPVVLVACIVLTRQGLIWGPLIITSFSTISIVRAFVPETYAGVYPIIHVLFLVPPLLAIFFIHPWSGVPVVIIEIFALSWKALAATFPPQQVSIFFWIAISNILVASLPLMIIAYYLTKLLRELDQKVLIQSADLVHTSTEATYLRHEVDRALQVKEIFLRNLTHELRTPLNAILNFVEYVRRDGDLNDEQRFSVSRIRENAHTLNHMIDYMLESTYSESEMIDLHQEEISLGFLLESAQVLAERLVAGKDIRIVSDTSAVLPLVFVDVQRISEVFFHLLSNAAKFTEAGTITIRSHWQIGDPTIKIAVRDTGVGMPADQAAQLFQRAYQRSAFSGGLSLCERIITLHKGSIQVESMEGKGTTFTITLPTGV